MNPSTSFTQNIRHNWSLEEIASLYEKPLLDLLHLAQTTYRAYHKENEIQLCTLLSIKTGACPEDCAYCPQSARHNTHVEPEKLLSVEEVVAAAHKAKAAGSSRFCMGAAWRNVKDGSQFDRVLEMIREVKSLGLEACVTLGMLSADQATRLKEAGLDTYNHNLDTSREFYKSIITTRTYDDRIKTLENVRNAGIQVCCGGIIGMGESHTDRYRMLQELSSQKPHPESVPINALVPVKGTPLGELPPLDPLELVRTIATARILMPTSKVRLSAGRSSLNREAQILCLMAGANSIFYGEELLTTPNPSTTMDQKLLTDLGLTPIKPKTNHEACSVSESASME